VSIRDDIGSSSKLSGIDTNVFLGNRKVDLEGPLAAEEYEHVYPRPALQPLCPRIPPVTDEGSWLKASKALEVSLDAGCHASGPALLVAIHIPAPPERSFVVFGAVDGFCAFMSSSILADL